MPSLYFQVGVFMDIRGGPPFLLSSPPPSSGKSPGEGVSGCGGPENLPRPSAAQCYGN